MSLRSHHRTLYEINSVKVAAAAAQSTCSPPKHFRIHNALDCEARCLISCHQMKVIAVLVKVAAAAAAVHVGLRWMRTGH